MIIPVRSIEQMGNSRVSATSVRLESALAELSCNLDNSLCEVL